MNKKQVKSRERVRNHGEVYTGEREVQAMLNLVEHETERIDSRFLEPACGTGNFLVPILERKITFIKKKHGRSQVEFERQSIIAVGSIYGIDLLVDNVRECRQRLFSLFDDFYTAQYKKRAKDKLRDSIRFILKHNIVVGDALDLKHPKTKKPIIFSHWSLIGGSKVKRHDYIFEELIPKDQKDLSMFDVSPVSDLGTLAFLPKSIKQYPPTHILDLLYEKTN